MNQDNLNQWADVIYSTLNSNDNISLADSGDGFEIYASM
jgi:hypothetical protein